MNRHRDGAEPKKISANDSLLLVKYIERHEGLVNDQPSGAMVKLIPGQIVEGAWIFSALGI
jgi:hypothetical protein